MINMNLEIKEVSYEGKKRLEAMSDVIVVDVHSGEGFESGQTPETHKHLFELSVMEPFKDFDEIFERLEQLPKRHDKYENGFKVFIDNNLFASSEGKDSPVLLNKDFPKEIIEKYEVKEELKQKKQRNRFRR